MAEVAPLGRLLEDELIPPGVIGDDHLGVEAIVDQLQDLVWAVRRGSAIGLFGSPGIGKSTIGDQLARRRLLGRTKDGKSTELVFVPVDASESGGAGFRRRVVLACAEALGKKRGRIDRQLRGASSHSRFGMPNRPFVLLIPLILLILAVMVAAGLGIAKLVALVTGDDFESIANQFVLAMLFAPAVAAAAFGLLARSVTTEWSLPAPSSDDEFVTIFDGLFKGSSTHLLVFVDEIDRAPPDRIADILDGLRTFFGKGRCVFVVAADRQTLEHALSSWLGESTPEHAANPYYGAASAYLDKLFEYQLIVPPARTNALYQYARRTTEARRGVWAELKENDSLARGVIDVLIPPHITSPRQVNALLNGFAVTSHLLRLREPDMFPLSRMTEIAKLVCLRSEFPLFAADLHVDPRLPHFVLEAARTAQPAPVDADRLDRAAAYAHGLLPVSAVPLDGGPPNQADATVERELRRQHSRQLIAYLDRTRHVPGPGPDIIHAQAFLSDLGPELSEQLSEAALKRDTDALDATLETIRARPGDVEKSERDVLDMLSQRARARQSGDTVNALRSLLHMVLACEPSIDRDTAVLVRGRITSAREEAGTALSDVDREALELLDYLAALPEVPTAE